MAAIMFSEVLPKVEEVIGRPLSPHAITKYVNELYADVKSLISSIQNQASGFLIILA